MTSLKEKKDVSPETWQELRDILGACEGNFKVEQLQEEAAKMHNDKLFVEAMKKLTLACKKVTEHDDDDKPLPKGVVEDVVKALQPWRKMKDQFEEHIATTLGTITCLVVGASLEEEEDEEEGETLSGAEVAAWHSLTQSLHLLVEVCGGGDRTRTSRVDKDMTLNRLPFFGGGGVSLLCSATKQQDSESTPE